MIAEIVVAGIGAYVYYRQVTMSTKHPKGTRLDLQRRAEALKTMTGTTNQAEQQSTTTAPTSFPISQGNLPVTSNGTVTPGPITSSPTAVVVIMGLSSNSANYSSLQKYVQNFYRSRIPSKNPLYVTDWRMGVAGDIKSKFGTKTPLVIVGFSFGGERAVETCSLVGNPIRRLILLDPVDFHNPNKPNTAGFKIPANVGSATCYYRGATSAPWSGKLNPLRPGLNNIQYKAVTSDPHGEKVWDSQTFSLITSAL